MREHEEMTTQERAERRADRIRLARLRAERYEMDRDDMAEIRFALAVGGLRARVTA